MQAQLVIAVGTVNGAAACALCGAEVIVTPGPVIVERESAGHICDDCALAHDPALCGYVARLWSAPVKMTVHTLACGVTWQDAKAA